MKDPRVEHMFEESKKAGLKPLLVTFMPMTGCRACHGEKKATQWTVTAVGKKIPEDVIYLWSIVTLGDCCFGAAEAEETIVQMMLELYTSGN